MYVPPPASAAGAHAPLKIAFLGDDTLRTLVRDDSPTPCAPPPYPAPCHYEPGSADAPPNLLSDLTANTVYVLSSTGTASTTPTTRTIQTIIAEQVPKIKSDTDLVVLHAGDGDSAALPEMRERAHQLIAAVKNHAPHSRLIIIGLRPPDAAGEVRAEAWNAAWRSSIRGRKANEEVLDLEKSFPLVDYGDFPDGVHPSKIGARRLASMLAAEIAVQGSIAAAPRSISLSPTGPTALAETPIPRGVGNRLPIRSTRIRIAVVGSSMARNVVLDGSPAPCGTIMRAKMCKYEDPSPLSYPTFLGALVNAEIINLSVGGSQAADVKTNKTIEPALDSQVPKIPHDANVVLLDIGVNDTSINGMIEPVLARVDKVVAGVHARVPHSHIIFVSLRDYGASVSGRLDAWNAREARTAAAVGAAYIDMRSKFPAADYADFPDGTHTSPTGALKVAQAVAQVIDAWRVPDPKGQ